MLTLPISVMSLSTATATPSLLPSPPLFHAILQHPAVTTTLYMVTANIVYLARRAHLRHVRKRDIWVYRTTRNEGVTWRLYAVALLAWQIFVAVFPVVEPLARLFGFVSFMYDYPNAHGFGYILEPLAVQPLSMSQRTRQQIRLDWHAFSMNVGQVGRDGYRHPPSVKRNLPHLDAPRWGIKHWPWRRRKWQE
jgi:hypothetical protein